MARSVGQHSHPGRSRCRAAIAAVMTVTTVAAAWRRRRRRSPTQSRPRRRSTMSISRATSAYQPVGPIRLADTRAVRALRRAGATGSTPTRSASTSAAAKRFRPTWWRSRSRSRRHATDSPGFVTAVPQRHRPAAGVDAQHPHATAPSPTRRSCRSAADGGSPSTSLLGGDVVVDRHRRLRRHRTAPGRALRAGRRRDAWSTPATASALAAGGELHDRRSRARPAPTPSRAGRHRHQRRRARRPVSCRRGPPARRRRRPRS